MKKVTIFYLLSFSLLISSCCLRGRDDQKILLPDAINQALPYQDAQQVLFLSNLGDTLKTTVQASNKFYSPSCAECYCESKQYENKSFIFSKDSFTVVAIIAANPTEGVGTVSGYIDFIVDNSFFSIPLSANGKFECDTLSPSTGACYNSLVIQNQTYQNVFQLEIQNVPDTTVSRILYNADKGLLRMERKDGRFWEVL